MERLSTRENEFASLNMVNNQYSKYVLSQEGCKLFSKWDQSQKYCGFSS